MSETAKRRRATPRRFGLSVLALMALLATGAPLVAPYDPNEIVDPAAGQYQPPLTTMPLVELANGRSRLADRVERVEAGLVMERLGQREVYAAEEVTNLTSTGVADRRVFLLGSDKFGRDIASRALYGARISLFVGLLSILLAITIGVSIGAVAALGGPLLDGLLMRAVDGLLAFPSIFLLIALAALFPSSTWMLILVIGGTSWMGISRLTRSELMSLEQREFVLAARGLGAPESHVFFRHLLPHALTPLLVEATLRIGDVILIEAALSYLGLGISPPNASWGNMISSGQESLLSAWWIAGVPAACLIVTVLSLTLASDALRDRLDPRRGP